MPQPIHFWQPNTTYPPLSYIFDGAGGIQFTPSGGISGGSYPPWASGTGSPPVFTTMDGTVAWTFIGYGSKSVELLRRQDNIGPYVENLNDAVSYSRGASPTLGSSCSSIRMGLSTPRWGAEAEAAASHPWVFPQMRLGLPWVLPL